MTEKILNDLIYNVSHENLVRFFRERNSTFQPKTEKLPQAYEDEMFTNGVKLGVIPFGLIDKLIVCAFDVSRELTERSGKKAQYDMAKKIIRDWDADAGIFVFIGANGAFRFSLVYQTYLGTKAKPSDFRRFTYFVNPQLTNKTFIQRVGERDFSSLESIKDAFSVEKVTKEFYQKISYWYFWACQKCQFPKDAEAEENGRQVAVIRLITRMIFIWFMREMKLVPNHLFDEGLIRDVLTTCDPQDSSYYKAILQNLFFATLNTKPEERTFRSTVRGHQGYNPDFGNQYKYRYQDLFYEPEQLKDYFGEIPFLNGGLFDCLDDKEHGRYVDGFTETKKHQPQVPNDLFFSPERPIDINAELGTSNRPYRVEGLINILSTYNFTIDENTLDDQDVALDPELLGKVFENLLASFNPETSTTARKATGSYYTPREIVDYMVEEALKGYFQTHLEGVEDLEEKLKDLFDQNTAEHRFTDEEARRMVALVENVRIVDPAVGSGAFPMGALNKLVFILSKLDKDNALWKKAQLDAANAISDPAIRKQVIASIETYFREKDANYGRKLYLIQKCIYGVDIQQIAVEIAKLRFFIALLVDEKVDKHKDNWGIEPLPNLDFKIMQGNSLISEYLGINFSLAQNDAYKHGNLRLFADHNKQLIENFDLKKIAYQTASDPQHKKRLQGEIENLLVEIFEDLVRNQKSQYFKKLDEIQEIYAFVQDKDQKNKAIREEKQQLARKTGFDFDIVEEQLRQFTSKQRIKPFFPWELYFSEVFLEKDGFDIVIANPPYIGESGNKDLFREVKKGNLKKYYLGKMDYFYFFFHLAFELGNPTSVIAFISTNYFLTATGAKYLRNEIKQKTSIVKFVNFNEIKIFESAQGQHSIITLLSKVTYSEERTRIVNAHRSGVANSKILSRILSGQDESTSYYMLRKDLLFHGSANYIRLIPSQTEINGSSEAISILNKMLDNKERLGDIAEINQGVVSGCDSVTNKTIDLVSSQEIKINDGIFVFDLSNPRDLCVIEKFNEQEKKLLRPFFKNSDITKFHCNISPKKYLLYIDRTIRSLDNYPNIALHLNKFYPILIDRREVRENKIDYFQLQWPRSQEIFLGKKIVSPYRSKINSFAYNDVPWYCRSDCYITKIKKPSYDFRYVLALLNSKLYYFWLFINGKRKGDVLELFQIPLSELPIKNLSCKYQEPFVDLVDDILSLTNSEDYMSDKIKQEKVQEMELEIDQMVYKMYQLSEEEIAVVETFKITS